MGLSQIVFLQLSSIVNRDESVIVSRSRSGSGDDDRCTLLQNVFDFLIQLVLAALCFSSLVLKWWFEKPRRPFKIWALDTSKQVLGFLTAHFLNILLSYLMENTTVDSCVWYFVNIMLDTTLTVLIAYLLLKGITRFIRRMGWDPRGRLNFGNYGDPVRLSIWLRQILLWVWIVVLSKIIVSTFVFLLQSPLGRAGHWLLTPVINYSGKLELVVVMVIVPVVMNSVQLWIQDSFLKWTKLIRNRKSTGVNSDTDTNEEQTEFDYAVDDEPLLRTNDTDAPGKFYGAFSSDKRQNEEEHKL